MDNVTHVFLSMVQNAASVVLSIALSFAGFRYVTIKVFHPAVMVKMTGRTLLL
jgi:hypothetical protein